MTHLRLSLREVVAEEQGFEAAAVMVLHTWNQKLDAHAHVHALVPGGGPSLDEEEADRHWVRSRRRNPEGTSERNRSEATERNGVGCVKPGG